tara:strand:+ start:7215 stop:10304 length:3090 start_codon:yes stop_codon:yes gene_type:complete
MNPLKQLLFKLFNTKAASAYLLIFALAIGIATFIENDFGTSAAQKLIYKALWFEVLLVLFCITLIVNVIVYRFIQLKKWPNLIFHLAIVVIVLGAGITRYFGYEGVMHIREGKSSNVIYSAESYLNFKISQGETQYQFDAPILISSLGNNRFEKSYKAGNSTVGVKLKEVIPNPQKLLETNDTFNPTIKVVFGTANGRQEYFVSQGETKNINGQLFNFTDEEISQAFNIKLIDKQPFAKTSTSFDVMTMATQTKEILPADTWLPLKLRALYNNGNTKFVFGDFSNNGQVKLISEKRKIDGSSEVALNLEITINNQTYNKTIVGTKGNLGTPELISTKDIQLSVAYGAKLVQLPFELQLNKFNMARYPGTNSPASFESEVTLYHPEKNFSMPYKIFMNNILDYEGYRFFQSSYDQDEKGTYLSANHDFFGTWVTYIGYILLTLGMIMVFFSKGTRFSDLRKKLTKMQQHKNLLLIATGVIISASSFAQVDNSLNFVNEHHAELASQLVVQDFRGRMKPMHSQTRELLRKFLGSEAFQGKNADQVILTMYSNPEVWYGIPIIKMGKHPKIADILNIPNQKLASYKDFFNPDGSYKLKSFVAETNNKRPADRGIFDKNLIKVDERVNIVNMVFSGYFLKVIPLEHDANNTWVSTSTHSMQNVDLTVANKFFTAYRSALSKAIETQDFTLSDKIMSELSQYQQQVGVAVMPATAKIKAEIFLTNLNVFTRLAFFNFMLGLIFLALLFFSVFKPKTNISKIQKVLTGFFAVGLIFHLVGLGLRWYVSGRAPWSNGYESMIYIAFTSSLAGFLFSRKSIGAMAATLVLSGTVLLIALLSYLDPEITPLVPVLNSYWLTIHVSLEAGSYGFLLLGGIIGLINLLLIGFSQPKSKDRILSLVKEMSYISEMTLIGGLVMLSVGTYLGGVWANESWGRYWGWDAKETWALVSILVYAFILHMRLIPGLRGFFAFNFASLFGLSSIIMTYFGVNYYLSGLHSYAAGDPIPVPNWVYVSAAFLALISAFAYFKKKRLKQF